MGPKSAKSAISSSTNTASSCGSEGVGRDVGLQVGEDRDSGVLGVFMRGASSAASTTCSGSDELGARALAAAARAW